MDFHTYITMRDWTRRADPEDRLAQDIDQFYKRARPMPSKWVLPSSSTRCSPSRAGRRPTPILQPLALHRADAHPVGP